MIIAAWFFTALAAVAVAVYIGAWVYDHKHNYRSAEAIRVGFVFAMPMMVVFSVLAIVFFDLAHEDEPSTKVTIECEIGDNEELACEVVE